MTRPTGPLAALLAAPGGIAFFDGDFGCTVDGSNKLSLMLSRLGGYTVEQATGAVQPTWGVQTATGRRGVTLGGSQHLTSTDGVLAGILDGSQAYSVLTIVKRTGSGVLNSFWSCGSTTTNSAQIQGTNAFVHTDVMRRVNAAGGADSDSGSAVPAALACITGTYSGAAHSSWIDGTQSVNAAANIIVSTCDRFSLGATIASGTASFFLTGELYAVLLALGAWTDAQRVALQAAAKTHWGTP